MGLPEGEPLSQLSLPPGFRFYPTDEELMVQYLCRKIAGHVFPLPIIGDVDLYKYDPWDLPEKALFGEKEWYFFSPRDRKYPNGSRPNRVAGTGYWKATGTDKVIISEGRKVGIKKALVFYIGKAPKGTKTNWIMHEYRLFDSPQKNGSARLDDWVLCRIYKKRSSAEKAARISGFQSKEHNESPLTSSSQYDELLETLPEIEDRCYFPMNVQEEGGRVNLVQEVSSGNLGWGGFGALSEMGQAQFSQSPNVLSHPGGFQQDAGLPGSDGAAFFHGYHMNSGGFGFMP